MEHDFTPAALSPAGLKAKEETRQMPLDAVRESSFLWSHKTGMLQHDWMELSGKEAPTFHTLLEAKALVPGGPANYVGVDLSRAVIQGCQALYGPSAPAEWHVGRLESLVSGKGAFPNVGVLVFDTEDGVWRGKWDALDRVVAFARRQADAIGEFVLVVNVVNDPRFATPKAIGRYLERLSFAVGHEVTREALHGYKSKELPMLWTMVTFGF